MERKKSESLFKEALQYFPGGVNSPVRAFKSVGGTPIFFERGKGAKLWDADGNEYIDYCHSWGPLINGHAHQQIEDKIIETLKKGSTFGAPTQQENELARLILKNHRYIEKIRFVSSGTEAVMSALRLARAYTKKDKIIKFEGCYHGHFDGLLVKAGSGVATLGKSSYAGVTDAYVKDTLVAELNDFAGIDQLIANNKNEIAAIIIEPIPANNGLLRQSVDFLEYLREICTKNNILLIFDEVISGFRVHFEGASGFYDIQPDIITFGKIMGGGLPAGAYAASAKIMAQISPEGLVYQAGTLSGNPLAMAAGAAQLTLCLAEGFYEQLAQKTEFLVKEVLNYAQQKNYPFHMPSICGIFWLNFSDTEPIVRASQIGEKSVEKFNLFYQFLLENGIYLGPSAYEVGFVSSAHSPEDLAKTAEVFKKGLDRVYNYK